MSGTARRLAYAERMGAHMAEEHLTSHMSGRVYGALLVSASAERSIDELAGLLRASRGAISMATKDLMKSGIVERISRAGDRKRYYRLRPNVWSRLYLEQVKNMEEHVQMAEEGLELMRGESSESKERLLEMGAFFRFILEEMPSVVDRWKKRAPELIAELESKFEG